MGEEISSCRGSISISVWTEVEWEEKSEIWLFSSTAFVWWARWKVIGILAEFLHFLSQTDRRRWRHEWSLPLSLQEIVCSQPLFAQLTQVELIKIYVHQERQEQQQARQLPVLSTTNCLLLATTRREEEMKNKRWTLWLEHMLANVEKCTYVYDGR